MSHFTLSLLFCSPILGLTHLRKHQRQSLLAPAVVAAPAMAQAPAAAAEPAKKEEKKEEKKNDDAAAAGLGALFG